MRRVFVWMLLLQNCVQCSYLIIQPAVSQPVHLGDTVTLTCLIQHEIIITYSNVYWMRQQEGQAPLVLVYSFLNSKQAFQTDVRSSVSPFTMSVDSQSLNLTITGVNASDAGIYFCAGWRYGKLTFGNGTRLTLTGSSSAPPLTSAPPPTCSSAAGACSPHCGLLASQAVSLLVLAGLSLLLLLVALVYIGRLRAVKVGTQHEGEKQGRAGADTVALTLMEKAAVEISSMSRAVSIGGGEAGDFPTQGDCPPHSPPGWPLAPSTRQAAHRQSPPEDEIHYASMNLSPTVNPKHRVECNLVYAEVRQESL